MPGPQLPSLLFAQVMLLAAFGQPWAVSMASAADIAVTSEIEEVTVFPTGAEIVRTFTVQLEPGEHSLKILLPHDIQRNSIQIEGKSQGEVSISDLDLRLAPIDTSERDARAAELRAQIVALEVEVGRHAKTLENAAFSRNLVETLAQRTLQPTRGWTRRLRYRTLRR